MKTIILASSSPRRKELLKNVGLKFRVESSAAFEQLDENLEPRELACRLSLTKARAVARRNRNAIVIAADTIGVLDRHIIGKPQTEHEAFEMLKSMSGKCHTVITGITVVDTDTMKQVTRSVETRVFFKQLSDFEIRTYVRSGEPMDKAGAYAIQGLGSLLVQKIEGDYFNVMGLPLSALAEVLKEFGVDMLRTAAVRRANR